MKLWHDDIRRPPDSSWTWARTNAEALAILRAGGVIEASLDHDLGLHELDPDAYDMPEILMGRSPDGTGFDLVKAMCEEGLCPDIVRVHSWNPDGRKRMVDWLRDHGVLVIDRPFTSAEWSAA